MSVWGVCERVCERVCRTCLSNANMCGCGTLFFVTRALICLGQRWMRNAAPRTADRYGSVFASGLTLKNMICCMLLIYMYVCCIYIYIYLLFFYISIYIYIYIYIYTYLLYVFIYIYICIYLHIC